MKSIGIIQPARLGDLIILLPAAHEWHTRGYEVVYPIMEQYVWMFEEVAPWCKFIPVSNSISHCVIDAKQKLEGQVDKIFDVACTFRGSSSTPEYHKTGSGLKDVRFDLFKYNRLDVDISEKWKLLDCIQRNVSEENKLFEKEVSDEDYILACLNHSDGKSDYAFKDGNVVYLHDKTSLFYWIKVMENAKEIVMVDSAPAQLVEQLNIGCKKVLISRGGSNPPPTIRNEWTVV